MTAPTAARWRRELPEHVTVTVDGTYPGSLDALDEPVPCTRPAGRVVVTMPDFTAVYLAQMMADLYTAAHLASGGRASLIVGPLERALAEGLAAAAEAAGYRSPRPLVLPVERLAGGEVG